MADIINLNKFRKQKARADKKSRASENIARKGRTKLQKTSDEQDTTHTSQFIDRHKLENAPLKDNKTKKDEEDDQE